jgi:hypothetical protein
MFRSARVACTASGSPLQMPRRPQPTDGPPPTACHPGIPRNGRRAMPACTIRQTISASPRVCLRPSRAATDAFCWLIASAIAQSPSRSLPQVPDPPSDQDVGHGKKSSLERLLKSRRRIAMRRHHAPSTGQGYGRLRSTSEWVVAVIRQYQSVLGVASTIGQAGTWSRGDFDCTGDLQFPDFVILADNFGQSSRAASVSEPSSIAVVLPALLFLSWLVRGRIG